MDYIDRVILAQELTGYNLTKLTETLHSNEAKMLLLGRVFDGEEVTLRTAVEMMWSKCVDDDMTLCVNRAKAFLNEYVEGSK